MMRRIVGSSLRFRLMVVAVAAGLMAFGVTQLHAAPRDVYPEFSPTYVEVQTEALGLSAAEVEQFITVPFESYLLNGVAWLETIRSESVPGLSSIVLVFEPGTDLLRARQMVQERLTQASFLPRVSKAPVMLQPVSSTSRAMVIGMSSETVSLIDMGVLARWNIKPRLMGLPGVATVSVWGARDRQLQVQVDPARLREARVSLDQVIETTGNALQVSPLTFLEASTPGTGGFIDGPNQRLGIRHVSPIRTPEDLANVTLDGCTGGTKPPRHVDANCPPPPANGPPAGTVVNASSGALTTPAGRPLQTDGTPPPRLGDVTTVVEDHQPLIGDAVVNDGKGLLLVVEKLPWANTLDVTREVEAALAALQPGLEGVEFDPTIFRPASFIDRAVDNLTVTALIALGLIALALAALLFRWRTALVVLVTIPMSLLAAALVLHLRGTTFNAFVFAGLVVATGAVVDDAVTAVHAMTRRLREQPPDETGTAITGDSPRAAGKFGVILEAAVEARGALLFATLVIVAPVVPLFFMDSLTGSLLRPAATSYALALFASFAVALTVTPALGLLVLRGGPRAGVGSPALGWLQRGYEGLATRFVRSPRPVALAGAVLVVAGMAVLPFLRQTTVPEFKETDLLVDFDAAPGTSLQSMERMTAAAGKDLRSLPGVRNVGAHVGRAIMSDEVAGANSGELWVSLDPDADYDATVASIQGVVDTYGGIATSVLTYPDHRIAELLDTAPEPVVVRIYGDDPEVLGGKADEVRKALSGIDGVVGARVDLPPAEPTVEIEVDLPAAQRAGIKPGDVRRAAATLMQGLEVGNLFEEQKVFDVIVVGTPETRNSVTNIADLLVDKPNGDAVRLGDVAYVRTVGAPNVVRRDAVSRYAQVAAGVSGRDSDAVLADVDRRLQAIDFPVEYHAEVLGDHQDGQATQQRTLILAAGSALLMFFLLQAAFASWRLAGLLFLTLPLALTGGAVAAFAAGGREVSLGSLIGFLAVLGVAARNGVLLLRHYQHLQHVEGERFGVDLVLRGARDRAAPILTTAATVALAFAPFALRGLIPGQELVQPMAVVVLGGLVTTTLVSLFVLPALYLRLGAGAAPDLIEIDLREQPYSFAAVPATEKPPLAAVTVTTNGAGDSSGTDAEPTQ